MANAQHTESRKAHIPVQEYTGLTMHEYTSFAGAIDVLNDANGPAGTSGTPGTARAARAFCVLDAGAGTKKVSLLMCQGQTKTISADNLTGVVIPVAFQQVLTGTTVAKLLVIW